MKKQLRKIAISILGAALMMGLSACGSTKASQSNIDGKSIKVGVCAGPYGDMFEEAIKPSLEEKGYKVEMVEFSDYVQPNNALADKEIDVNMFQHSTYLKNFSSQHGLDLTYITEIPTAGMAIFLDSAESIEALPQGGKVAIPNDDTNLSRALRVLAQTGVITLDPEVDPATVTPENIIENKKDLTFTEVNAEVMTNILDSVDAAIINGNYALSGGLNLADALYNEQIAEGYFNVIAVRTEDKDSDLAKAIVEIVGSDGFKGVIEDESKQYVSFSRPANY